MTQTAELWTIIIALGVGSFAIRFAFLGLVGDRPLPPWLLRHLRYTAVAIIPALVAPLVVWSGSGDLAVDPVRYAGVLVCLTVAIVWKNVAAAVVSGALIVYGLPMLL